MRLLQAPMSRQCVATSGPGWPASLRRASVAGLAALCLWPSWAGAQAGSGAPASALIPLFLLIFGISNVNKVAIAAFGAFLIVVFNCAYGVINARKQRVAAAKVMGASRWQIFKDVLFWESLQPSFVGLRSAVSMALVIVVVAEMFIGSENGLGHKIIDAQQVMNVRVMYAAIMAAGILGYALNIAFLALEKRIVHWSGR